jgi:hypothetical protein
MSGRVKTEKACVLSWLSNWHPCQREEFAKVLKKSADSSSSSSSSALEPSLDDLLSNLDKMTIQTTEGPSVFECQLKIFSR